MHYTSCAMVANALYRSGMQSHLSLDLSILMTKLTNNIIVQ